MKPSAVFALVSIVAGAAVVSPAMAVDMSGSWQVNAQFADATTTYPFCTFQQGTFQNVGERFAGSCKGPSYLGTASGTTQGQQVQFTWDSDAFAPGPNQLQYAHVSFSGVLGPDGTIRGSATDTSGASGTFTATRR